MASFTTEVSPFTAPNYDLFSPARRADARGVVLGAPLDGAQSYTPWIGLTTVRELALQHADKVGLVTAESLRDLQHQLAVAQNHAESLRARLVELEAAQERIAGLASAGFQVVKKQGRPTKKENS